MCHLRALSYLGSTCHLFKYLSHRIHKIIVVVTQRSSFVSSENILICSDVLFQFAPLS